MIVQAIIVHMWSNKGFAYSISVTKSGSKFRSFSKKPTALANDLLRWSSNANSKPNMTLRCFDKSFERYYCCWKLKEEGSVSLIYYGK